MHDRVSRADKCTRMEWGETDECGLKSRRSLSALEKGRLTLDKHGGAKAEG